MLYFVVKFFVTYRVKLIDSFTVHQKKNIDSFIFTFQCYITNYIKEWVHEMFLLNLAQVEKNPFNLLSLISSEIQDGPTKHLNKSTWHTVTVFFSFLQFFPFNFSPFYPTLLFLYCFLCSLFIYCPFLKKIIFI